MCVYRLGLGGEIPEIQQKVAEGIVGGSPRLRLPNLKTYLVTVILRRATENQ
jgi:hypothetical protein